MNFDRFFKTKKKKNRKLEKKSEKIHKYSNKFEKWDYGCTNSPYWSPHIDAWRRNYLQLSKVLIQIQDIRETEKF